VFFFFPALYGASQLRRPGAICVLLATVTGEIVVVVAGLRVGAGIADAVYVSCALLTTVALLVFAGERQDALIAQLQQQAAIDPLTGLATRRVLDQAAQSALSGGSNGEGTALILLDVDDFKSVNDRYGHPAGDEVLIQLATLLTDGCREGDIVSRMGGDEIAMLLPGCSPESVARRADQIMWDVRATAFIVSDGNHEVHSLSISVSAGLAHAPTHALDVQAMYATADAALYAAKRGGRNRVVAPPNSERATA
jgi:diguanylate cyclase (GGDEF)-like protein